MALQDNTKALKSVRQRNYLARDFDGFRTVLLDYARQYYPNKIQDFSEASLGGLLIDLAAYVGDNLSFYLDHLYSELNYETAIETKNIEKLLRSSGITIAGAAAATAIVDFYIEVPVSTGTNDPDVNLLPTILEGTTIRSDSGIIFTLLENVNFWSTDSGGNTILAKDVEQSIGRTSNNAILTKILKKSGLCGSGTEVVESIGIGSFVPFRNLTLGQSNVTQIISVVDGYGNEYYEVDNLASDVVYKNVLNTSEKDVLVRDSLKVIPAPYRFTKNVDLATRSTTLTFGGGSADSLEDDIVPDPSEFAIPLPYSQTFSRISVNPNRLLNTSTLGVATANTTLSVRYRYGGGLNHNVPANSLKTITSLSIDFPENPNIATQAQVRSSLETSNPSAAVGGEEAPTSDDLLALIPSVKYSQERVVTKEDLLARVYTMPSNFGRVFRAAVSKNPTNPLAVQLFIISRDAEDKLIVSSDTLKTNLRRYLNTYRMISDAIDIKDAAVVNLSLYFTIVCDPSMNKSTLLANIIKDLSDQLQVKNLQINQPIVLSDIVSTIFARKGVIAVDEIVFKNVSGTVKNREYSSVNYDVVRNTRNSILYPPNGGIFEVRFPEVDIVGKAVSDV